ncbi:hypothetical protein [Thalassotalea ganghwensis]
MISRRLHRIFGLTLLLPMIGWALTGVVFFIKPGYQGAYEMLKFEPYPLDRTFTIVPQAQWLEFRLVKSVIGYHLLVKTEQGSLHLEPQSLQPLPIPELGRLTALFESAIAKNPERYGSIEQINDTTAITTTGINIELNWPRLSFSQHGIDKRIINTLYKIHYLQWTPWSAVNQVLGILGLALLMALSFFGVKVYLANREK